MIIVINYSKSNFIGIWFERPQVVAPQVWAPHILVPWLNELNKSFL